MEQHTYDVLVIGGGPAGLGAALYLARYDRTAALIDSGKGRSTWHQTNYNLLGFPGGIKARDYRELARRQLSEYSQIQIIDDCMVERMSRDGDWYVAHNTSMTWRGRAVILCMGVIDHWPEFPGWEEYVGRSMFWCITCDGYTCRDQTMVVVGNTDMAASTALQLQRFSKEIKLLTNSDKNFIGEERRKRLSHAQIPLVEDKIVAADGEGGYFRALHTERGLVIPLDCLFNQQGQSPRTNLARDLGCALNDLGYIITDSEQKTSVSGVYAAGDSDRLHDHQISVAVAEGGQAASAANYYLYPPELKDPE